jgi:general secretion pathway protein A
MASVDLLSHWRLRERPFEAAWDTRYFFASRAHEEALERLLYLVAETTMGFGMISGEVGCGKTLTRAVFAARLDPARNRVVTLENSGLPFNGLLAALLRRLEPTVAPPGGLAEKMDRIEAISKKLNGEGRHLVILLDEAQDLGDAALRHVRWLANLNGEGSALVTVILIGQPELRSLVADNPAVDQRIGLRFHLPALDAAETAPFLDHRLRTAGGPTGLFTAEAVQRLFEAAKGVPREINRLAKLALEQAWLADARQVQLGAVDAVVKDLQRHQPAFG